MHGDGVQSLSAPLLPLLDSGNETHGDQRIVEIARDIAATRAAYGAVQAADVWRSRAREHRNYARLAKLTGQHMAAKWVFLNVPCVLLVGGSALL